MSELEIVGSLFGEILKSVALSGWSSVVSLVTLLGSGLLLFFHFKNLHKLQIDEENQKRSLEAQRRNQEDNQRAESAHQEAEDQVEAFIKEHQTKGST